MKCCLKLNNSQSEMSLYIRFRGFVILSDKWLNLNDILIVSRFERRYSIFKLHLMYI